MDNQRLRSVLEYILEALYGCDGDNLEGVSWLIFRGRAYLEPASERGYGHRAADLRMRSDEPRVASRGFEQKYFIRAPKEHIWRVSGRWSRHNCHIGDTRMMLQCYTHHKQYTTKQRI